MASIFFIKASLTKRGFWLSHSVSGNSSLLAYYAMSTASYLYLKGPPSLHLYCQEEWLSRECLTRKKKALRSFETSVCLPVDKEHNLVTVSPIQAINLCTEGEVWLHPVVTKNIRILSSSLINVSSKLHCSYVITIHEISCVVFTQSLYIQIHSYSLSLLSLENFAI